MATVKDLHELLSALDPAEPIIFEYFTRDMFTGSDDDGNPAEISREMFTAVANEMRGYGEQPGSYELRECINDEIAEMERAK